jgi:hypothetical protein
MNFMSHHFPWSLITMNKLIRHTAAPALAGLAVLAMSAGCGPKAEEPTNVVVAPPSRNLVIKETVENAAPVGTPKVVVKPGGKQQTTVINKSTTTVVVATPKPNLPAPAPQPAVKATPKTAPTAARRAVPPPPGPRMGSAPPRIAKAPPSFTKITTKPTAAAPKSPAKGNTSISSAPLVVQGQIVSVSKVPDINRVPYQEALLYVKYKVVSVEKGDYKEKELLAALWGMQKKKLLPATRYKVGDTQRLELVPLSDRPDLEKIMVWDTLNEYELTPYFVAKVG